MWSVPHSGHVSVTVTVTDRWFLSLLHRPCTDTTCKGTASMHDRRTTAGKDPGNLPATRV